jgi:hypothetical protein
MQIKSVDLIITSCFSDTCQLISSPACVSDILLAIVVSDILELHFYRCYARMLPCMHDIQKSPSPILPSRNAKIK